MAAPATAGVFLAACDAAGEPDAGRCLPELPRECTPLYEPTFQAIFDNRLRTTCGSAQTGRSCHGPEGRKGGLTLSEPDQAYAELLREEHPLVLPEDPECSELMRRLESDDPAYRMPPGRNAKLSAEERCAILLWIAAGAAR